MTKQEQKAIVDYINHLETHEKVVPAPATNSTAFSELPRTVFGNNWCITRRENQVIFGCGAVRVRKTDLLIIAEYKELEAKFKKLTRQRPAALARLTKAWRNNNGRITEKKVYSIPSDILKKIAG